MLQPKIYAKCFQAAVAKQQLNLVRKYLFLKSNIIRFEKQKWGIESSDNKEIIVHT